jgi:hypothetical protein
MSGFRKKSSREAGEGMFEIKDPTQAVSDPTAQDTERRHDMLMECLEDEKNRQAENRYQMALDQDFYDSLQWSEEDAQTLMSRGQAPMVFNKIKPTINWITGTEKRTRIDYNVLPREAKDEQGAQVKKKLLKYLSDVNRLQFHRSDAFFECVTAGIGWLEEGISSDPSEEMIYAGSESWRNVFHDSRSRKADYSDGRYILRSKVLDLDFACAMFPDSEKALKGQGVTDLISEVDDVWYLGQRLTNARDFDSGSGGQPGRLGSRGAYVNSQNQDIGRREQVRVTEGWYTVPMSVQYFANGELRGTEFNPKDEMHQWHKKQGVGLVGAVSNQMRVMIFTDSLVLFDGRSPYKHRKFPLTPLWCYRRQRDGMPYGVIRDIRDPQEDLNKRRSKALYILSANRVVMDKGAVDDMEELRDEASRPDAVIVKNPNKELRFEKPAGEFQGNLELAQHDEAFIQEVSGVTSENLGQSTNATSGKAILARQEQGSVVTANIFDNMRMAVQMQGEKLVALMEQYYTAPKVIRIIGEAQPVEWLPINQVDPNTGQVLNDITSSKADFVISEQDFRASLRLAAQETMTQLMQTLPPEVALSMLDLVVDLWDLPQKEEWLQRIRKINGQRDPTVKATPEELQQQQAMQQKQAQMEQLQAQGLAADVALKQAQAQKIATEAQAAAAALQTPQANPELAAAQQQLAQLTQQLQEAQTKADRMIYESKIQADERVRQLEAKMDAERLAGMSKEREITSRNETELGKARIQQETEIEKARIEAAQTKVIDGVMSKLTDLQKTIADMGAESKKAQAEHERELAAVEKASEKKVQELEKALQKTAQDLVASVKEAKESKAEAKEAPAAAPPVINVNVAIDGTTGEVTKEIQLDTDKDGNVTGGRVTQKPAKKPAKKE